MLHYNIDVIVNNLNLLDKFVSLSLIVEELKLNQSVCHSDRREELCQGKKYSPKSAKNKMMFAIKR